jgi:asparagine synthase (glutamine-hydrolysing)
MSAIFGIIDFTGSPIEPEWITSMQNDLAHRGPDGEGLYQEHGVALGHKLLHVTPESIYDHSPYEEDGFVITAHARLDERQVIMDRIGVPKEERDTITDPLLLLRSFRKFGKDFVKDIYGDFAFVIWDKENKELFCARDQMGVKPFLYYLKDGRLAFSTELKSLVRLSFVETEADLELLRDQAIGLHDQPTKTAWKNIVRLHAAHHLGINKDSIRIERYWDLVPKEDKSLKTEEQSAEKLRELLFRVIDDHTRVIGTVGVPLSGGLDSSTIACIAARKFAKEDKNIVTASSILDSNEELPDFKDEKEFINEVIKQEPNIEATYVYHTELKFLDNLNAQYGKQYSTVAYSYDVDDALNKKFKNKSSRRILSGLLGDMTTSNYSVYPLPHLLVRVKLKRFVALSTKYRKTMHFSKGSHLFSNIIRPMIPFFVLRFLYFSTRKKAPWECKYLPLPENNIQLPYLEKRMRKMYKVYHLSTFNLKENIWSVHLENLGENWDCGPSYDQLEYSYPLIDRRIVEFLVSVPVAHFYAEGYKRGLIRLAMKEILPEKVRLRLNKMPYSPADELIYNRDLIKITSILKDETFKNKICQLIDCQKMEVLINDILKSKKRRTFVSDYWTIISLSMLIHYISWIKNNKHEKIK